ncbi:hypothetical protein [Haloarchaeobius sp. FL176]|uniref:hypothetical protein n=1 Tax=Haloarchaeobius sp. FL176 TaxID=2967129 RepID=UPI002148D756|nr:hypothetical protein [Haloarchaeobius sp. FL176]
MKRTLAVLACVMLTVAALPVAVADRPAPATAGDAATADTPPQAGNNSSSNRSMGGAFSTFTQSAAADADAEIEGGMWTAAWNGSGDNATQVRLVEGRTNALEARLDALQEQRKRLQERRDEMSRVAYRAQLASLTTRLAALGSALNQTEEAAREVGVNTTELDRLRQNASELTGPEVAEMARELGGGGPPEDVPGLDRDDCETERPNCGNETGAGEGGPGDDPGQGEGNRGNTSDGPGNAPDGPDDAPGGDNSSDDDPGNGPGGPDDAPGGGNGSDDGPTAGPGGNGSDGGNDGNGGNGPGDGNGGNGGNGPPDDGIYGGDTVLLEPVRQATT